MFPETDLSRAFWAFVRQHALDERVIDDYRQTEGTPALLTVEFAREYNMTLGLGRGLPEIPYHDGDPKIYETVQEALLGFLLNEISGEVPFRYPYEVWLRVIVLVLTQAQLEPDLLTIHVPLDEEGRHVASGCLGDAHNKQVSSEVRIMRLDGEWECLSRETFDLIVRIYGKTT